MKKQPTKRLTAWLLALTMLAAAFALVIPASAADIAIATDTGMTDRIPYRVGKTYSYRANIGADFTGFGFHMPTWEKKTCYATLTMYQWAGSYDATLKTQPVATKKFDPLVDSGCHWVEFTAQPAGEYLFHISDVSADVGVWLDNSPKNPKGFSYMDGIEQRGEPQLVIRFPSEPAEPFGPCEASGDVRNLVYPYDSKSSEAVFNMNGPLGVHLNVDSSFVGVQFKMATYTATDMTVQMNVYKWKGNYTATIEADPVAGGEILMVDNAMQGITFDELPAGEYLFLTENYNKVPAMYVYTDVSNFKGYVYKDGFPWTTATQFPVMQVICNSEKEAYFKDASKPGDTVTGDHVAPPAYVIPEDSLIYTHPVMPDTWVFTDGLGRVSLTNKDVGDLKEDKTLAMFFWTWHIDNFVNHEVTNLQKTLEEYPDIMRDYDNPFWADKHSFWWNESIYGFYRGNDQWVLRKQAELLANAGVDVIFTDNTNNGMTWRDAYTALLEEWDDAMSDGLKTPKLSFMLPFWDKEYTNVQMQSIYLDIFRADKYQNLWFYWDDKPMIMAMQDSFGGNTALDKEIRNFFTFRAGQPAYKIAQEDVKTANWGWLSMYPQAVYYAKAGDVKRGNPEQITVGIAQNHDYVNGALAAMSGNNIAGRSYTSKYPDRYVKEGPEASKWGYNFAEQWEYALEIDPKVVFVTGWNEFRVGRYEQWPENPDDPASTPNAFPDQYSDEFSRDIEPTKGALKDHYYYQLVNYSRQFKGARPIPTPSGKTTIDLNAGYDQWKTVEPYFGAYIGNTEHRDSLGYGSLHYTETSGRNDIIGAQVARDGDYVYFLVECAENITPYTDSLWMNLYIDTDQQNQGWNTFEYVVGKTAGTAGTLVLEKFTAADDYSKTQKVADVEYKVDGRYMTVKIAKADLGLTGDDYTINFSWTDNVHDEGDYTKFSGDIMDFYVSGDVAPGGRFKFSYISTSENATSDPSDTDPVETQPTEDPTTDGATDVVTVPATDGGSGDGEGGCKSSVAAGAAAMVIAAAAAAVALKKKED